MNRSVIRIIAYLLLAVMSCLVVGCNRPSPERIKMDRADALMETRPDSSLVIMQSIDSKSLHGDEDKALYALLLTRVQDKNYITVTDDSLISIAVKYFDSHDDLYRRMLSHYYYGTVKMNAGEFSEGVTAMHESLEMATELDDKFWMGMSCRSISDIYLETYSREEELAYAKNEYRYFKESGRQPYIDYAMLDLARAYSNSRLTAESLELCRQIVDSAKLHDDTSLLSESLRTIGKCHLREGMMSEYLKAYQEVCCTGLADSNDSAYLCLGYIDCGNLGKANAILDSLYLDDELMDSYIRYHLYKKQNNAEKALVNLEIVDSVTNATMSDKVSQNITASVVDHFDESRLQAEKERDTSRIILYAVIIITVLIISVVAILWVTYYRNQQNKIENNVVLAEHLREMLTSKEQDYTNARESISQLLTSRFQTLDDLCKLVYESNDTKTARKRISDNVTSLIEQMKNNPSIIDELEVLVNRYHDNLMVRFRKDLPYLNDNYYRLFLFSVLGFSDIAISIFLSKEKTSMIWNSRRHLKDKIKKLPNDRSEIYIQYLS